MRPRPPAAEARVPLDVGHPERLVRLESGAEHAVRARERPHQLDLLVAHAGRDELREAALAVGDAEGGVARVCEPAGHLHEAAQDALDRALAGASGSRARAASRSSGPAGCTPRRYFAGWVTRAILRRSDRGHDLLVRGRRILGAEDGGA